MKKVNKKKKQIKKFNFFVKIQKLPKNIYFQKSKRKKKINLMK